MGIDLGELKAIIAGLFAGVLTLIGWIFKSVNTRVDALEHDKADAMELLRHRDATDELRREVSAFVANSHVLHAATRQAISEVSAQVARVEGKIDRS